MGLSVVLETSLVQVLGMPFVTWRRTAFGTRLLIIGMRDSSPAHDTCLQLKFSAWKKPTWWGSGGSAPSALCSRSI